MFPFLFCDQNQTCITTTATHIKPWTRPDFEIWTCNMSEWLKFYPTKLANKLHSDSVVPLYISTRRRLHMRHLKLFTDQLTFSKIIGSKYSYAYLILLRYNKLKAEYKHEFYSKQKDRNKHEREKKWTSTSAELSKNHRIEGWWTNSVNHSKKCWIFFRRQKRKLRSNKWNRYLNKKKRVGNKITGKASIRNWSTIDNRISNWPSGTFVPPYIRLHSIKSPLSQKQKDNQ